MSKTSLVVKKVQAKCDGCDKDSQCFVTDEVFENGLDWKSDPLCNECFIADKMQDKFEEIVYNHDDDALKSLLPAIKNLSDESLLQFLKYVGRRMEF